MTDKIDPYDFAVIHKDKLAERIQELWAEGPGAEKRKIQDRTIAKAKGESVAPFAKGPTQQDPWKAIEQAVETLTKAVAAAKGKSGVGSLSTKQLQDAYSARLLQDAQKKAGDASMRWIASQEAEAQKHPKV